MRLTPEELRARKRRNVWIASALVAFIVLVFATTVLRLQQNQAAERELLEGATGTATQ
jgi:CHASE2 domain-containing sensor protein